jgi:hypothetical protein
VADQRRIVKARLGDDGPVIGIEVVAGGGEADVARGGAPVDFDQVATQIEALAKALATPITALHPSKATLEFGCSIGVESGQLTALLVKGSANANLKVSLEWTHPA